MWANIKNSILFLFFISGIIIFFSNINNLNLINEDLAIEKISDLNNTEILKEETDKPNKDGNILLNNENIDEEVQKIKKTIVIVKKGQTFSSILDAFNFENKKKYQIINSVNKLFNLKDLKVDQKIIFFSKSVLNKAIKKGGSSIRDFKNTSGKTGNFQKEFKVYRRENLNCLRNKCAGKIKKIFISNRSSFFCNMCQK